MSVFVKKVFHSRCARIQFPKCVSYLIQHGISSLFQFLSLSLQNNVEYSYRNFSRLPKWFRMEKNKYDIVDIGEVGPKRKIPRHIEKPSYAETGVAEEADDDIEILNENKLKKMRQSCALAKLVLEEIGRHIGVGVTTDELDCVAHTLCISYGAYPSPLNYRGFPKSICTSVNNIACHGIPDDRKLKDGDIISVDVSVFYNGFHGDCASTFCVGDVDIKGRRLVKVASLCLEEAIRICCPDQMLCQIGKTISTVAKSYGYSVIPAFCGHGIGSSFHSHPNILHYENEEEGIMSKGMIFTIEPVICEGKPDIVILEDGWTATTEDNSRSAQFEHTILITETAAEILTVSSAFKTA
ncbi:Methionine aminopeptidase 1D, mitochondrial, partial [Stegodyphus mimosarum]